MAAPYISDTRIREILSAPLDHGLDWRAHGIGFMKAYLDPARLQRINVYHEMLAVPGISIMHDHPWGLFSYIRAGRLTNVRWHRTHKRQRGATLFSEGIINCADYKGIEGKPVAVWLSRERPEVYHAGDFYNQRPEEIHETSAVNGTITLLTRTIAQDGRARIFWPEGKEYGDATRNLSEDEIYRIAADALGRIG